MMGIAVLNPSYAGLCSPMCMSRAQRPRVRVEIRDELVPGGNRCLELRPECGVQSAVEISGRHALLLDPGVVAEVENPPPVHMRQLDPVIIGDGLKVAPENLAGVYLV